MLTTSILSTITSIVNNTVWKSVTKSIEEALSQAITEGSPTPHWRGRAGTRVRTSLKEIAIQTSTYGKMLCKVYGTAKVSGNIIWAQPIKRVKHKAVHVKHNSQSVKHTTSYHATLAIAICSGPIHRLSRMWANGKPLDLATVKHRLYKGTEDQEPDPLMFSAEKSTPAYRGIAYIVVEDLPLQDYNGTVPGFTFEVTAYPEGFLRDHVIQKIYGIHTVGSREFSYDTETQKITQTGSIGTQEVAYGTAVKINGESGYTRPNALLALDAMQGTLTNVQWVAVTVYWFTDGPNIRQCKVRPATMYGHGTKIIPDTWKVGNFTATNAYKLGPENGRHTLKGTANDVSLVRYIRELKSRGYKVLLLPKLIVNFEEGTQLVCENPQDIGQFFDRQYRPFMEHYCLLTGGIIDAFVIGSGFTSLTRIKDGTESFPAVEELIRLAELAKKTLGSSVVVTYAANWDEYHSYDGTYNMDALWASEYVDVIGINAYFPLADTPNPMHRFSIQSVARSWHNGEGYNHPHENFPPKQSEVYHENPDPAWKNIHQWWSHDHINRHSSKKTAWQPKSKKVWFIEYGFRSVTDCTYRQLSPEQHASVAGSVATDNVDFFAQKTAIEGTLDAWHSSEMVERMFLYAWNLEPYVKTESYSYQNWQTGHWVNGKIDSVALSATLQSILGEMGLRSTTPKEVDELVLGYSICNYISAEAAVRELATIYCLDMREEEGGLIFSGTNPKSVLHVPAEDIIPDSYQATYTPKATCGAQALLYISLGYQSRLRNPQARQADWPKSSILQTSLVLDDLQAEAIVDNLQYLITNQNCFYRISLPIKYAHLNVGDVIGIELEHMQHMIKIVSVKISNLLVHLGGFIYTPMHFRQESLSCIPRTYE
ncbi:MAG: glycoside hydrolase TIM-barrel-like domain-containing protein [Anaplasma ovis]